MGSPSVNNENVKHTHSALKKKKLFPKKLSNSREKFELFFLERERETKVKKRRNPKTKKTKTTTRKKTINKKSQQQEKNDIFSI